MRVGAWIRGRRSRRSGRGRTGRTVPRPSHAGGWVPLERLARSRWGSGWGFASEKSGLRRAPGGWVGATPEPEQAPNLGGGANPNKSQTEECPRAGRKGRHQNGLGRAGRLGRAAARPPNRPPCHFLRAFHMEGIGEPAEDGPRTPVSALSPLPAPRSPERWCPRFPAERSRGRIVPAPGEAPPYPPRRKQL